MSSLPDTGLSRRGWMQRVGPWAPLLLALILFSVALTGLTRQDAPRQG